MGHILLPVSGKYFAKISIIDSDLSMNHNWFIWHSPAKEIYPRRNGKAQNGKKHGPSIYLHREIAERMFGEIDKGLEVDHINRKPLDCRRKNIRLVTRSFNMNNKESPRGKNSLKGISRRSSDNWRAVFRNKGIGTYKLAEDAALAYDRKVIEYFGEEATTNQSLGLLPKDDGRELKTVVVDRTKRKKTYTTNKSGYSDVRKRPSGNFQARIRSRDKTIWCGSGFSSALEAHEARVQKLSELGIE